MARELDIVVWGATGFTGELAVCSLTGKQSVFHSCTLPNAGKLREGVRFGLAGRNKEKLEKLKQSTGCPDTVPIFIAEASDRDAIKAFVSRTKVVVSCGGPFQKYSDVLVGVCAETGTHYVDITGELAWVRSVSDRFDDLAKSSGAVICNMCGFDSIPFDLLALYGVNRLREKARRRCGVRRAQAYLAMKGFGFSGGSLATGMLQNKEPLQLTKGVDLNHPFLLGGMVKGGVVRDEDHDDYLHVVGESPGGFFTTPSVMQPVNSRIVRKSAAALDYGDAFSYTEVTIAPTKKAAEKGLFNAKNPAGPEVIEKLVKAGRLPKPGQGPTPEQRAQSKFSVIMRCEAEDGTTIDVACSGGEAGYEETARMVVEAGIQLACNTHLCPGVTTGGVLTPACALGENMVRAMHDIGIRFDIVDADEASRAFVQQVSKL